MGLLQLKIRDGSNFVKPLTSIFLNRCKEILLIGFLFSISFLIRFYKLPDNLFFGFEQGRDAEVIKNIYSFKDFILTGPSTSIGGVFHGPWYYYMMAIPYSISSGSPLAAAFLLIILGSIVPVIIYFLAKDLLDSKIWGFFAGILTLFSYEYILYSRWLSNVSPAPLFIALSFLFLLKYSRSNSSLHFSIFVINASLASLFQMILLFQFIFIFLFCLIFKVIKLPKLKALLISALLIMSLFGPLIVFDFRNQHISSLSLWKFITESNNDKHQVIVLRIVPFWQQTKMHFTYSLINIDSSVLQMLIFGIIVGSLIFLAIKGPSHQKVLFVIIWILMSVPLIYISPGNPQYYVGVGLGWILVFAMVVKVFWEFATLRIVSFLLIFLILKGWSNTFINLTENKNVFFRTIQDDLNLSDQRKILSFIHEDSKGVPYKLIAFTIPYLHSEGWEYLHGYYYPNDKQDGAKLVYIVVESHVAPVWEEKWIKDLGNSQLISEKYFGKLRLQKRILEN